MLEQAKKRDHKIIITDMAIDKVKMIELPDVDYNLCENIFYDHKKLLTESKNRNSSNEVLIIRSRCTGEKAVAFGDENEVSASQSPNTMEIWNRAKECDLVYMHNHPATNIFSIADLQTFIRYSSIGTMSVVTNQGEVHIVHKTKDYSFNKAFRLLYEQYKNFKNGNISNEDAVKKFLKQCRKGGVYYARS